MSEEDRRFGQPHYGHRSVFTNDDKSVSQICDTTQEGVRQLRLARSKS